MDLLTLALAFLGGMITQTIAFVIWIVNVSRDAKDALKTCEESKAAIKILESEHQLTQIKISDQLTELKIELSKIRGMLEPRRKFEPS